MTDHKALIAEARLYDNTGGLMGAPGSPNATLCDLIRRLAAALEEAQVPEGWRVVQYDRDDGASVVMIGERSWRAFDADENPVMAVAGTCSFHPTDREAMAALEK